jgi:glycosyltransferase involved in cell wall biosynthesis
MGCRVSSPSLSVIVPALDEESNLGRTLTDLTVLLPSFFEDWEILVFNDGSTDRTGEIADKLGKSESRIRVFHHPQPKNLGGCYRQGVKFASKQFLILVPGDGECGPDLLRSIFERIGEADVLIPYPMNPSVRSHFRRKLSKTYTHIVNFVSGLGLRYYNGTVLYRTEIARRHIPRSSGFDYQAEGLIRALRAGHSYREIPVLLSPRSGGKSKALHPRNWIAVTRFLLKVALTA